MRAGMAQLVRGASLARAHDTLTSEGAAILEKPVSDRSRLEDLSQSREITAARALQIVDSKDGEMLERSIRHAWKAKRASSIDPFQSVSTHTRSATSPSNTITPYASVNLDVLRGFEPHVSQSYHNRGVHLRGVARYVYVRVQSCVEFGLCGSNAKARGRRTGNSKRMRPTCPRRHARSRARWHT